MLKKAMTLAVAAAVLAALTIPAAASAKWAHTVQPGGQVVDLLVNQQVQITGKITWSGDVGQANCEYVSNVEFTAGTTTAHAQFDVDNNGAANDESKCDVGGGLKTVGCTDVEQVTVTGLPWAVHAIQKTILEFTTGTVQAHLTGNALCPKTLQYTPSAMFIQFETHWWNQGALSGTVQQHISMAASQTAIYGGTATMSPASTYGTT